MPNNTCDNCNHIYPVVKDNSKYVFPLKKMEYLHVEMNCPECTYRERVFISVETLLQFLPEMTLDLAFLGEPNQEMIDDYAYQYPPEEPPEPKALPPSATWVPDDQLPPAPRDWLRNLWDTLREFGD